MNTESITDATLIHKEYIAFDQIAFVSAALSKDDSRHVLTHMQITRQGLITHFAATDGHRLHIAELDPGLLDDDIQQLTPGLYSLIAKTAKHIVIKKTEDHTASYPDWKEIIGTYRIGDTLAELCHIEDPGKIGEIMIRTNKLLDTTLLTEALGYRTSRKPSSSVHVQFQAGPEEHSPITIAHDHGTAFLMPMHREPAQEEGAEDTHHTAAFKELQNKDTP